MCSVNSERFRCCIDKTSSAELSEAINSMFRWYAQAQCCYAHLTDVEIDSAENMTPSDNNNADTFVRIVSKSRWFTRGWTLRQCLVLRDSIIVLTFCG